MTQLDQFPPAIHTVVSQVSGLTKSGYLSGSRLERP